MIHWELKNEPPNTKVLIGATLGQQHLKNLLTKIPGIPTAVEIVVFDFRSISLASASYLKAGLFTLLKDTPIGAQAAQFYAAVANVSAEIIEELQVVSHSENQPCLCALKWNHKQIEKARILGSLEPTVKRTLELLTACGETTAGALGTGLPSEGINATAWNNRLAELYRLRLATRRKEGKHWYYSSVAKEIIYG